MQRENNTSNGFNATFEARFYKKIKRSGPIPPHCPEIVECWMWLASTNQYGYGHIYKGVGEGMILASRAMWILTHKEIPKWMCVLHKCDNPKCVNPNHLFLGTQQDNMKDKQKKGRGIGCQDYHCPNATLDYEKAEQIRNLRASGMRWVRISEKFGVTTTAIRAVVEFKTWKPENKKAYIHFTSERPPL